MSNYENLTIGELLNTNNSEILNSVLFQLQVYRKEIGSHASHMLYFSRKVSSSSKLMPKLPNTWPVQILILKQAKIIRLLLNQKQLDFIPIMKIASGDLIFKI